MIGVLDIGLSRGVVEFTAPGGFKERLDVILGEMV